MGEEVPLFQVQPKSGWEATGWRLVSANLMVDLCGRLWGGINPSAVRRVVNLNPPLNHKTLSRFIHREGLR